METLRLEATQYTPEIVLDPAGVIAFSGKSYPENTFDFYQPVMDWLEQYFSSELPERTVVNMEIIYFNSSSSKLFFDMFDLMEEASAEHALEVNWIYDPENESAREAGEDFIEDFDSLTLNLVEKG
ncbi:Fe-S oxidoreductase [Marinobacterium lacunae]|uniref:Fe-S oxidoreductase n=1 Tax=Marinobacterium lacunae TaxID=1232683 RepID=A0A081G1L2_9GAMM|nr:DUF1987 domain-containing protein [Marinobacterium lacunae]KEA64667.1 Fe-S oxidoreductase [Marinobacterium lacunae]MBR9882498.1 DUF1987 domain-containing protein [Oceanospirillales bacterium]